MTAAGIVFTSNLFTSCLSQRPISGEEFVTTKTSYGKIKGHREPVVDLFADYFTDCVPCKHTAFRIMPKREVLIK